MWGMFTTASVVVVAEHFMEYWLCGDIITKDEKHGVSVYCVHMCLLLLIPYYQTRHVILFHNILYMYPIY